MPRNADFAVRCIFRMKTLLATEKLLFSILAATVACCLSSCSEGGYKTTTGSYHYSAVPAQNVDILFTSPNRPYKQIGIVSALGMNWSSDVAMDKKLQKCAADLGADAVILTGATQTGQVLWERWLAVMHHSPK
jgi:hypothetical protein